MLGRLVSQVYRCPHGGGNFRMRILGKLITELEALYAGLQMGARAYFRSVPVRPIKTLPATPLPEQELERLPSSYGKTRLVMLAIDSYTVHAFWEVTLENLA